MQTVKHIQRSIGHNGTIVGKYDDNPMINSIIYDVEFPDDTMKEYSANPGGCHRSQGDPANAVSNSDKYVAICSGQRK